jgi:hypothetical protein
LPFTVHTFARNKRSIGIFFVDEHTSPLFVRVRSFVIVVIHSLPLLIIFPPFFSASAATTAVPNPTARCNEPCWTTVLLMLG